MLNEHLFKHHTVFFVNTLNLMWKYLLLLTTKKLNYKKMTRGFHNLNIINKNDEPSELPSAIMASFFIYETLHFLVV